MTHADIPSPPRTPRAVRRGLVGPAALAALLLALAVAMGVWTVPASDANGRAWRAAVPCTAPVDPARANDCLVTAHAVIDRFEIGRRGSGHMYFTGGRPVERTDVGSGATGLFGVGDEVELTFWRGEVMTVTKAGQVWNRYVPSPGPTALPAALLAVLAGYPAAVALTRLRCRGLPEGEVLPSTAPYAWALAGTALWLLPLCYLHPLDLSTSSTGLTWAAAGALSTAGLGVWAWRATRVRTPEEYGPYTDLSGLSARPDLPYLPGGAAAADGRGARETVSDVFLTARFLDATDYNPNGFGTHIVLGDGRPAVTPGPGRFTARKIPAARLSLRTVRRVRGSDGERVPRHWHVAELDDADVPVRLAAAPADLARILCELGRAKASAEAGSSAP